MEPASLGLATLLLLGQIGPARTTGGIGQPPGTVDPSTARTDPSTQILTKVEEPDAVPAVRNVPQASIGGLAELRTGHPTSDVPTAQTEVEIDPFFAVRFPVGPGGVSLAYDPRIFIVGSYTPTSSVYYLHRGRLLLDTQAPRERYFVTVDGAYGKNDFLPLSTVLPPTSSGGLPPAQQPGTTPTTQPTPTPTPANGRLPDVRFVEVANLEATAGLVYAVSPRVSWLASAGYLWSGGANATAQQTLPLQKGPFGSTGPIWSLSPGDTLAALLHGYHARFSNGPKSTGFDLTGTWTHQWSRSVQTDLIGGAAVFSSSLPGQPTTIDPYPVAGFAIHQSWIRKMGGWRNTLQVLIAPLPDRLTGVVYQRAAGILASTWAVDERLSFLVTGSAASGLDGNQRDARVEGRVSYAVARELSVSLGGRVAWLQGSTLLGPTGFGWTGLLTITTEVGSTNQAGNAN